MTKNDLIKEIQKRTWVDKTDVQKCVNELFIIKSWFNFFSCWWKYWCKCFK
ncbi:hypothetical protein [Spiroplasma endosymbiont of Lariophagus distinguendus]|uniref:hypothetical protein n=1 Tax=Spiroplasma endosymbiont of Lariophagus distinguendus TaxID=2935082 RepID=UPI00207AE014|nr:hypothetical protein [Spiroplasma endosymbiont of Lariophagus distinguendus]